MEYVPNSRGLNIIIDYAVTPDSLEKLYQLIKEINKEGKKIIAVFGACGQRDRGKRPLMGEIVARYANDIFLTNEDPYEEDPNQIINEVFGGVVGEINNNQETKNKQTKSKIKNQSSFVEGKNCWRMLDRRGAIRQALILAQSGDFVIITGKGAEEIMAIGKKRIPWKEKEVISEELAKL
jgi:UDP-N-acetylmuramoyl-L-alanyl-D-glutamate--2,6-diaminopimelate ligase